MKVYILFSGYLEGQALVKDVINVYLDVKQAEKRQNELKHYNKNGYYPIEEYKVAETKKIVYNATKRKND